MTPVTLPAVIVVDTTFEKSVDVSVASDVAYALVADVFRSGSHFPAVERLTPVDDAGRWHWKLKEKGIGPVRMRPSYEAVYVSDPEELTVVWSPPESGAGDMRSYGSWKIEPLPEGCRLHFTARTVVRVPAPGIMRKMVQAFAREETIRLKGDYLSAIVATLEAG